MQLLNLEEGKSLANLARETVEKFLNKGKFNLKKASGKNLERKAGAFVTIHTYPKRELRGCIGFISPGILYEVVQQAAYAAAFQDPRFPPISKNEIEKVIFEISILTEPKCLNCKPKEYAKNVKIGEDGLIIQCSRSSGLLLPQVPVEQGWTAEEFLENLCFKAGLTPDYLHEKSTSLWKFQTQVFSEKTPNDEVEEVRISK
jgi:uncharacterized protein (TIGR00296 family)